MCAQKDSGDTLGCCRNVTQPARLWLSPHLSLKKYTTPGLTCWCRLIGHSSPWVTHSKWKIVCVWPAVLPHGWRVCWFCHLAQHKSLLGHWLCVSVCRWLATDTSQVVYWFSVSVCDAVGATLYCSLTVVLFSESTSMQAEASGSGDLWWRDSKSEVLELTSVWHSPVLPSTGGGLHPPAVTQWELPGPGLVSGWTERRAGSFLPRRQVRPVCPIGCVKRWAELLMI